MVIDDFVANAAISIQSSRREVWDALINPGAIKHYMFNTEVESAWLQGSEITWKGEFNGRKYEDKGVILKIEPEKMLRYSHYSPSSGKPDIADNYHFVTIYLADGADKTEITLTQDNNADEDARVESEKNWMTILGGLKAYVESV
ncbi:MAG: SRPBCC domain-containing protein [Arenimonas sp.]